MPRLSIAILSNHGPCALETTLVSVLENRPADCEIVVALGHAYDDPYQLDGEVRFVAVDPAASGLSGDNRALAECSGVVIHLLAAGTQVTEGWADAALAHFDRDAHIGSVAPLVRSSAAKQDILAAGIEYTAGGWRKLRRTTMALSRICETLPRPEVILGPSADAGFFRRAALLAACEALGRVAGDEMADADVALSLGELGYLSVLEPRSIVFGQATAFRTHKSSATLAAGRAAETVFWRHAAAGGWCLSLAAHAAVVACEMCLAVARPALAKRTFGRLLAALGALGHVAHAERLAKRHRPADDDSSTGPNVVSIDSDEPPAEPPRQPAAARRAA